MLCLFLAFLFCYHISVENCVVQTLLHVSSKERQTTLLDGSEISFHLSSSVSVLPFFLSYSMNVDWEKQKKPDQTKEMSRTRIILRKNFLYSGILVTFTREVRIGSICAPVLLRRVSNWRCKSKWWITWSTYVSPWGAGGSLLHRGYACAAGAQLPYRGLHHRLPGNLCFGAWSTSSIPFLSF